MDLAPALFLAIECNLGSNSDDRNLVEMMVSQMDVTKQSMRNGNSAYLKVEGSTWEEAEANANKLGGNLRD